MNSLLIHRRFKIKQNYRMSFKFLPRQPHHSPTNFIKTSRNGLNDQYLSTKFIPFVQERDSMGRLIKCKKTLDDSPAIPLSKKASYGGLSTELSHLPQNARVPTIEKLDHIQENINREFQYKCKEDIKSSAKNKISFRKNSLQIPLRKHSQDELCLPKIKQDNEGRAEPTKIRKASEVTTITQPGSPLLSLRRNTSLVQVKSVRKTSINEIDLIHEVVCSRSPQKTLKEKGDERKGKIVLQQIDPKASNLNIIIPEQVLTNRIQGRQISELNRYNTFKTLGLKLAGNLDQGHNNFMTKMRQTKKLAYKIKISLEST